MATFDLVFKGSLLPDHEPQRVKGRIAELFSIDDPYQVEQLFSGDTYILRGDLERKDAANYFRQVVEAGGQAELVPSEQHRGLERSGAGYPLLVASRPRNGNSHRQPQADEQVWAVSGNRSGRSVLFEEETVNPLRTALLELESKRRQATEKAEQELQQLKSTSAASEEQALEEINRICGMRERSEAQCGSELESLKEELAQLCQQRDAAVQAAEQEAAQAREQQNNTQEELAQRCSRHSEESEREIASLERERKEVAASAAADIARLEQLLAETREQARADDEELGKLLQAARDDQARLGQQLAAEKARLEDTATQVLAALQARLQQAGSQDHVRIEQIQQRQQALQEKLQQELQELAAMEKEAAQRSEEAEQQRQAACGLVRKRLDEALGQMAGEEQALRKQLAAGD